MSQDNIRIIKKRANTIQKLIKAIFIIVVIFSFAILISCVVLFFASPERFNAVKGNLDWSMNYKLTNGSFYFINIPFKIMQPLDVSMFIAKNAAITSLFTLLINTSLMLYGLKQIANILNSTASDITPFIMDNVRSLKKLAYSIILYSAAVDLLSSLLFTLFVTNIVCLNLTTIHLSGVLVGGLILVIADIFKYGVFLQQEFDTTL